MHATAAALAMRHGKHVYCQKPLVQTIYEARYLHQLAKTSGLVTQMGNQGSSADGLRRAVEVIQAGIIGQVREVHIWTNRPIWPQGMGRPDGSDPVPSTSIGIFGWGWRRCGRSRRAFITRSNGAAGRILAPARWAIWRAIR